MPCHRAGPGAAQGDARGLVGWWASGPGGPFGVSFFEARHDFGEGKPKADTVAMVAVYNRHQEVLCELDYSKDGIRVFGQASDTSSWFGLPLHTFLLGANLLVLGFLLVPL